LLYHSIISSPSLFALPLFPLYLLLSQIPDLQVALFGEDLIFVCLVYPPLHPLSPPLPSRSVIEKSLVIVTLVLFITIAIMICLVDNNSWHHFTLPVLLLSPLPEISHPIARALTIKVMATEGPL
jgi:hypothetical protein